MRYHSSCLISIIYVTKIAEGYILSTFFTFICVEGFFPAKHFLPNLMCVVGNCDIFVKQKSSVINETKPDKIL
jgi:hypothetical protein